MLQRQLGKGVSEAIETQDFKSRENTWCQRQWRHGIAKAMGICGFQGDGNTSVPS